MTDVCPGAEAEDAVDLGLRVIEQLLIVTAGDGLLQHRDQNGVDDLLPLVGGRAGRGIRRVESVDHRLEVLVPRLARQAFQC